MGDAAAIARGLINRKAFITGGDRLNNNMSNQNALKAHNFPNAKREGLSSILDRNIKTARHWVKEQSPCGFMMKLTL